jgi:hypothetical protein
VKDIIPFDQSPQKPCIQSLTEHNRIYCPVCHRTEGIGLSGWVGVELFIVKFGCRFCETRLEYRRRLFGVHPSELSAYRDQYFSEALREFAVTVAGKKPSENIHLLVYPKEASKIGRRLKIVWDIDKGGEILEKESEERGTDTVQEPEDESA